MVGHVHLMLNVYEDIHEIIMSMGMNIIVAIGFYLDDSFKNNSLNIQTNNFFTDIELSDWQK